MSSYDILDPIPELDFEDAERGRFHGKVDTKAPARLVKTVDLDPDVAKAFPDAKSVNEALRGLIRLAERSRRKTA